MPDPNATPAGTTILRDGSILTGKITGAGDVVIEGRLEGELRVDASVTVAPSGRVQGNVSAKRVSVAGHVVGNLVAAERVEVLASGTVQGDITAARLAISEGATLSGTVQINRAAPAPAAAKPAAPAQPAKP